jgi:hypothetical protein
LTFSALTFSKLTTALLLAWRLRSSRFCSNCVRQHHSDLRCKSQKRTFFFSSAST